MIPEQLRERCREFASDPANYEYRDDKLEIGDYLNVDKLESLYREAMAAGIKLGCHAMREEFSRIVYECEEEADMLKDGASLKAQAIKEASCNTSSS